MKYIKLLAALVMAVLLTACGGGGGSAGTTSTSSTSSTTSTTATDGSSTTAALVTDFIVFTDKATINNGGTDAASLFVFALDANRNVLAGVPVTVAVDSNATYIPSLTSTDAAGSVMGKIQIGASKANRQVVASVTLNKITKQVSVQVTGSQLSMQVSTSAPIPGQTVSLDVTAKDFSGVGISGAAVTLGGTIPGVAGLVLTTGASGLVSRVITVPGTAGIYTISATGLGIQASDVQLNANSGSVPTATLPSSSPSLSTSPNVLAINSSGSTTNRSTIRFFFVDSSNNPVSNVRVRFEDVTTGLAKIGASLTSGTQTVYTDSTGVVTTQYISGQNSSPTNGVTLRACYKASDFSSSTECPAAVTTTLTVAGQAVSVSIGDDNRLATGGGGVTYIKTFVVTVADSAGRPVANAPVDISVDLTHYGKGQFNYGYVSQATGTTTAALNVVPSSSTGYYPNATSTPGVSTMSVVISGSPATMTVGRVWCANEDTNRNGSVDTGENIDGSVDTTSAATLQPKAADLLISYSNSSVTTTNSSGLLNIQVEYAQRFGTWIAYRIRATATVSGSQGMSERLFVTGVLDSDVSTGSFLTPPYGVNSCSTAN